jgi:hypothetical protein
MWDLSIFNLDLKSVSAQAVLGAGVNNWRLIMDFVPVAGEKSLDLDFLGGLYMAGDGQPNILVWS